MSLPPRDHRLGAVVTPTVLGVVARLARASSDGALVLCATVGLVGATVVVTVWPALWPLALASVVVASFGGWGVADRAASELTSDGVDGTSASPVAVGVLRALRLAAGLLGVAALIGFIIALATRTLLTTGGGWF